MQDYEVTNTIIDEPTMAKGRLYGVEHFKSAPFQGFGLRVFGVELILPKRKRLDSLFVPIDTVRATLPYK